MNEVHAMHMLKQLLAITTILISTNVYAIPKNFIEEQTSVYNLDEIHSYVHTPTQMSIKWVENKDKLATFCLGVRTPTTDNTGVNHIIEHTVFTGSKKFPSGTLFFDANANFPHTYMNAQTAADYTLYPFQTPYEESFYGLLEVYLDSVFNPNMLNSPHSFYEESFYFDPNTDKYGGVVYNEMKGANSQLGRILYRNIRKTVYEGTHYQNDSGGDVAEIPKLTYQQFVDTYKSYYYPQNMMIALYGDLDINDTLKIIDTYLLDAEGDASATAIAVNTSPTLKYTDTELTYSTEEQDAYVIKSFVMPDKMDAIKMIELDLWLNTYVINPNSQFRRNLKTRGIEQIEIFKDQELVNPIYSIIVSKVNPEEITHVRTIIDEELATLFDGPEDILLEQDVIRQLKLELANEEMNISRGLDITHTMVSNWVHDVDQMSYYTTHKYIEHLSDVDEIAGSEIFRQAQCVNINLMPSNDAAPANPLEIAAIDQDQWTNIVTSMREWQKTYDQKVLEPTELKKMIIGYDIKKREHEHQDIDYSLYYADTNLLTTELYLNTSHIPQEELPHLFLYSFLLQEAGREMTPFKGILNSKIVAFEDEEEYRPYQKIEIVTDNETNQTELLQEVQQYLKGKDEHWHSMQIEKIISKFYSEFQNDIITTLMQLTNGTGSGAKRYLYEAHYPFYKFALECKKGMQPNYIEKTFEVANKLAPTEDSSVAIIGDKSEVKHTYRSWKAFIKENMLHDVQEQDYNFKVISKDSVYYKKGQVDYLLYNYDTKKDFVDGQDYLLAAFATKNYLQPEIRIKKGAYGSGMQIKFPNTISIYTYRDPHYKSSVDIINDMPQMLDVENIEEKLLLAKSEAISDFQAQFGLLGADTKKASIAHTMSLMDVETDFLKHTQKEIAKLDADDLRAEMENLTEIINDSKKGVCIKK